VELRQALAGAEDLVILWVMADNQINERTRRFVNEYGLRKQVRFLSDPDSQLIRKLGLLKPDAEPMELGVPHPTTLLLDREGIVRFADARENFHFWLDPALLTESLATLR
jgi:peroxiredoxin